MSTESGTPANEIDQRMLEGHEREHDLRTRLLDAIWRAEAAALDDANPDATPPPRVVAMADAAYGVACAALAAAPAPKYAARDGLIPIPSWLRELCGAAAASMDVATAHSEAWVFAAGKVQAYEDVARVLAAAPAAPNGLIEEIRAYAAARRADASNNAVCSGVTIWFVLAGVANNLDEIATRYAAAPAAGAERAFDGEAPSCAAAFPSPKILLRCALDVGHGGPHQAWNDEQGESFMQWPEGYRGATSAQVEELLSAAPAPAATSGEAMLAVRHFAQPEDSFVASRTGVSDAVARGVLSAFADCAGTCSCSEAHHGSAADCPTWFVDPAAPAAPSPALDEQTRRVIVSGTNVAANKQ